MSKAIIRLKDAKIYQKDHLVLSKVSFELQSGDFIYLIGKTGTGKSSLLKTLYGDLLLQEGVGEVVGFDLTCLKEKEIPYLRRGIGVVFQDFQLLSDRTINDNLSFVLSATGWDDTDKINNRVQEVLTQVGMGQKGYKMPHELSGGEQQRVAIARAIAMKPELILADEPTGNLDTENSTLISNILFKYVKEEGSSLIMVTHDPKLADKAKRKIKIKDGKIK